LSQTPYRELPHPLPSIPRRPMRIWPWAMLALLFLVGALIAAYELIASPLQAMVLAGYSKRLSYQTQTGENRDLSVPGYGPQDVRLGYVGLPAFVKRLKTHDFEVTEQARISEDMRTVIRFGLYPPYREKSVAGLSLLDCRGEDLYANRYPVRTYADFNQIPPVIANTLLFIENRDLLDPNHPQRNPAVEWDRFAAAILEKVMQMVGSSRNVPGGSTLATQIEKYRHSRDGLTLTASDKLKQMISASLRAYLDGSDTRATRRHIVLDYLNTVPLAAAPGYGEVNGIGDGLKAWFGLDFDSINRLLRNPQPTPESARAFKHVLSLLIAQRKPAGYLLDERDDLDSLADSYLRLLADAHVISPALRDAAQHEHIVFNTAGRRSTGEYIDNKAATALRVELASDLGIPRLYDLDRLDLKASSTLNGPAQRAVSNYLRSLSDPVVVEASGLYGHYLLAPENDLAKPIYSFTLYELTEDGAFLRVQADNLNQPFDINQGAKLDMGSSAKLRTLITYLQLVSQLRQQYAGLTREQLLSLPVSSHDPISQWMVQYLASATDRSLVPMLEAAMSRTYSASPNEAFFTGGGVHHFHNFHSDDDHRVMDLWEATRNSVNLPFIRLMRDLVHHFMYRDPNGAAQILADPEDPRRDDYLRQFADREGKAYLARFWKKYKGLKPDDATSTLLNHLTANPKRLASVFRYLDPAADAVALARFLQARVNNPGSFSEGDVEYLYETYGPDKFSLTDRGYIAQVHPLELWLVGYLRTHPGAKWSELVEASAKERIEIYDWLINTRHKNAQDIRILSLLEIEAFQEIHKRWRVLGYPFASLVPSYATAIGSSADRPSALAELMGVILNDGAKLPAVNLIRLEFGKDTPYHTVLKRRRPEAEKIFPVEIAQVIRKDLRNVVANGTARRIKDAFLTADGQPLDIGGKTGTGDHRFEVYSASGQVLESKVMNRTATFAFFLGSRFFGVMTAFVPGEAAAGYHFTSALAVQIVRDMEPALRPLVIGGEHREPSWAETLSAFDSETAPLVVGEAPRISALPAPGSAPVVPEAVRPQAPEATPKASAKVSPAPKPAVTSPVKPAPLPIPAASREPAEPPRAPPPPQVDKPDPVPLPAPKPEPAKENKARPINSFGEEYWYLR